MHSLSKWVLITIIKTTCGKLILTNVTTTLWSQRQVLHGFDKCADVQCAQKQLGSNIHFAFQHPMMKVTHYLTMSSDPICRSCVLVCYLCYEVTCVWSACALGPFWMLYVHTFVDLISCNCIWTCYVYSQYCSQRYNCTCQQSIVIWYYLQLYSIHIRCIEICYWRPCLQILSTLE